METKASHTATQLASQLSSHPCSLRLPRMWVIVKLFSAKFVCLCGWVLAKWISTFCTFLSVLVFIYLYYMFFCFIFSPVVCWVCFAFGMPGLFLVIYAWMLRAFFSLIEFLNIFVAVIMLLISWFIYISLLISFSFIIRTKKKHILVVFLLDTSYVKLKAFEGDSHTIAVLFCSHSLSLSFVGLLSLLLLRLLALGKFFKIEQKFICALAQTI